MKSRIIFLPVPELPVNMETDGFYIDPDIPIPIEIYDDTDIINDISIESILSAMLRVIEEGEAKREWIDYYSSFALFLRPDLPSKLRKIKEAKEVFSDEDYLKALKLAEDGKAEEALAYIRNFIEHYPLVYRGWFILGWALRLLGRWQDAHAALKKAIELGGDNCDTRNELAICLMETGDTAGAKKELETSLAKDPENVKIISNLAVLALKTGDSEKAAAFFRTILELDPNDPVAKQYLKI